MGKTDKMDRMEEVSVQLKSRMLASFLYVSSDLGMWCFGEDARFYYSTCPNETEIRILLEISGILDFLYEKKEGWDKPVMLSDDLGTVWVAEHMYRDGKPDLLFMMGPVFFSETSAKALDQALLKKDTSIEIKRQISRLIVAVPVILRPTFTGYIKMLHFVITGEQLRMEEIHYRDVREQLKGQEGETESDSQERKPLGDITDYDRVNKGEKIMLRAIQEGNLNYGQVFEEELQYGDGYISDCGNDIRDAKNTVLVFNALCCRAAIDGGVPAGIAKKMELANTGLIEASTSITELTNVNRKLLDEYVKRVHACKEKPLISEEIQSCCDYIKANVHNAISAESVAAEFGYSPYYFTKKFYREMGIRITDYIKRVRVEYAKVELLASRKSIQEISDSLQFSTRSYFGKVFSDLVGVSPAVYREQNRLHTFERKL